MSTRTRFRLFASVQFPVFMLCLMFLVNSESRTEMTYGESSPSDAAIAGQVSILEHDTATPKLPATLTPPSIQVAPTPVQQQEEVPAGAAPLATDVPESNATVYAPMTHLRIQSVGIDSAIEVKSIGTDGIMEAPGAPDIVSWYDFSSQSVDNGNAVFAGHLDYAGYGPAVFWRLGDVRSGDVIEVHHADGVIVRYAVTSVQPFAATDDASSVVAPQGRPTITLITCDGDFDPAGRAYADRLVVTGDRID